MKEENSKYIRFDHAAANTESVPFVTDEKIYTMRDKEQLIASALSSRDTEIHQVLERLARRRVNGWPCWCWIDGTTGKHDDACLATRALWDKVQPPS